MSDEPNYRALSPPPDTPREDYSYVERRAELYDLIEEAGHYRNLERSQRELGRRYGVSHTTIRKDIRRILEWKEAHLGGHAEAELETLKTKAVREALDNGDHAEAYRIASEHYSNLQSIGEKDRVPDQVDVGGGNEPLDIQITKEVVDTDGNDDD